MSSAVTQLPSAIRTQTSFAEFPETASERWLHVVPHLHPKYGGVSNVVPQLDSAISQTNRYSVELAGFCAAGEYFVPKFTNKVKVSHFPLSRLAWLRKSQMKAEFRELVASSAGLHVHGLWQQSSSIAPPLARKLKKPYVISAHGMLEPWALANKRWKKSVYMALVERTNLRSATCLHALTQAEALDYRRLGLTNPIVVIPNGVQIPERVSSSLFLNNFPELAGKRLILFLGRIHFKKGLDILCQAWAGIEAKWPDAQLVLAGPDFENTQPQIEQLVSQLSLQSRVTFTGMLDTDLKWSALAAADCFVLPSYSEGLSVSVLEAMGMGVPVVITENCNLPEVAEHECGWVIKPNARELEVALDDFLRAPSASLAQIASRGRRLVSNRYSWNVIGRQMTNVYRWMAGDGLPDQVDFQLGTSGT